jgi:hypothetical protein
MILMIVLWYLISFMRGIQLTNQVLFPKYAQYIYIIFILIGKTIILNFLFY